MNGYVCDGCEGKNPVVTIATNLSTGYTLASCETCAPAHLIGQLAGALNIESGGLFTVVKRYTDKAARDQAKAAQQERKAAVDAEGGPLFATIGQVVILPALPGYRMAVLDRATVTEGCPNGNDHDHYRIVNPGNEYEWLCGYELALSPDQNYDSAAGAGMLKGDQEGES